MWYHSANRGPSTVLEWATRAGLRMLALIVLCLAVSRPAAAQDNCEGNLHCITASFSPVDGSSFTNPNQTVTITVCALNSITQPPEVRDNGVLLNGFNLIGGYAGGFNCTYQYTSTSAITLTGGENDLSADYQDDYGNWGSGWATYTLIVPAAVAISPTDSLISSAPASNLNASFLVSSRGGSTQSFTLSVSCTGALQSCSGPGSVSVPANGSTGVVVSYHTINAGDTGSVRLTATGMNTSDIGTIHILVGGSVNADRPPMQATAVVGPGIERKLCLTTPLIGSADYDCGDLLLSHALPVSRTLGKERAPTLIYLSQAAHAYPLIAAAPLTYTAPLPNTVTASLYIDGIQRGSGSWNGAEWSTVPTRQIAVGYDAIGDTTGLYAYRLDIYVNYGSGPVLSRSDTGHVVVVNRSASAFNPGWWVAGVNQLVPQSDGSLLFVGGDGSARLYIKVTGRSDMWAAPQVDRRDWLKLINSQYVQYLPNGLRIVYSSQGRHLFTINRLSDTTAFAWTGAQLTSITVPKSTGVTYSFTYGLPGSKLSSVAHLVGGVTQRTTTLSWDNAQTLRIVDPGNQSGKDVRFYYDPAYAQRIATRYNRNGDSVAFRYSSGNKLSVAKAWLATVADSVVYGFTPAEILGLGLSVDTSQVYSTIVSPRGSSIVTKVWLDRLGGARKIQDALGQVTRITRGDARWPALVTHDSSPTGQVRGIVYDSLGHPVTITDSTFVQGGRLAVRRYEWDLTWDAVKKIVNPEGDSVVSWFHSQNGNRLWVQPGGDFTRRVKFAYANGLSRLSSTQYPVHPGNTIIKDSLLYDAIGNPSGSRTPSGYWTMLTTDNLGRVTQVTSPIDSLDKAQGTGMCSGSPCPRKLEISHYTARDLPDTIRTIGPVIGSVGPDTLIVANAYGAEPWLISLSRQSSPNRSGIVPLQTTLVYDAIGRKVKEYGNDSRADSSTYDQAGNVVRFTSRRRYDSFETQSSNDIVMTYDNLNRLSTRIVPSVTYTASPSGSTADRAGHWWPYYTHTSDDSLEEHWSAPGATLPLLISGDTAQFRYDAVGNLTAATKS